MLLAMEDSIIAAQNAVVAAESLGIGSCYIGDILENYEIHQELFHLPQYAIPTTLLFLENLLYNKSIVLNLNVLM